MGVDTFKIIQEELKASDYLMAKELGVTQTNYKYIKDIAAAPKLPVVIAGLPLAKKAGFSLTEYWGMLEKDALRYKTVGKTEKKKKK